MLSSFSKFPLSWSCRCEWGESVFVPVLFVRQICAPVCTCAQNGKTLDLTFVLGQCFWARCPAYVLTTYTSNQESYCFIGESKHWIHPTGMLLIRINWFDGGPQWSVARAKLHFGILFANFFVILHCQAQPVDRKRVDWCITPSSVHMNKAMVFLSCPRITLTSFPWFSESCKQFAS